MRPGLALVLILVLALLGRAALAQPQTESPAQSEGPVQTRLASAHLGSVIELPLFIRLYRVQLPAAQHASYEGASTMFYDLSGEAAIDIGGGATQPLAAGAGAFIAAGQAVTIRAAESEPTNLLLFVLTARPNERRPLFERPASSAELFRTPEPLPGLEAGPYEFSFSRVILPAGMPAGPAEYRSGAALDYVLAGAGTLTADGKTEALSAETPLFEGNGWVHQWANPGETPLVLLQASISREGDPAVVLAPAR